MGAELSLYSSYSLGESFQVESDIWEICPAFGKDDDQEFTVFLHDKEKQNSKVDTAIKYFQKLRHPGLLKCVKVFQEPSEIAIVTEAVVPLSEVVGDFHLFEVIAGIHNIIVTLVFLHEKCKLSHNNLSLDSIFVGQNDACWKIGGFEHMCPFAEIAKEKLMNESLAHAKDVLGLGKLICDVLDIIGLSEESSITDFYQRIQEEVVNTSVEKRPIVQSILNDEIFQNEYCQILDFLRNITVKTSAGKSVFFRTLHQRLHKVPSHIIANRLLHLLLSRFTLVDTTAVDVFLPHLLTPQSEDHSVESTGILPLLPEDLFRQCCIPILKKLFEVNDRHVRLILLKYFPLYVSMFEKDVLQSFILPELRLGLQDSDDELVSATFSAMQYLVPLLGAHVIIGGERQHQFTERRPKLDVESQSSHGSKSHRIQSDSSQLFTTKSNQSKSLQDKMQEREKRREETRRRNEERRKQKSQMGKKIAMKASVVEHVQEESGGGFHSWDNFDGVEKIDGGEISDESDPGRPSSSEISLDSGFSERTRNVIEQSTSPSQTQQVNCTEDINKLSKGKTSFGMKLGKVKGNTKLEKDCGKKLALKDIAKQSENKLQNYQDNKSRTNKSNLKINTSSRAANSSIETEYEDFLQSNEHPEDSFNTSSSEVSPRALSPTNKNSKKSGKSKLGKNDFGHETKKSEYPNVSRNTEKSKIPAQVVDKPWEDFGIKVTKKDSTTVDDIFADMTPTLVETRKAPVKGSSMYSDNFAVVAETTEQDLDGWMDDDW